MLTSKLKHELGAEGTELRRPRGRRGSWQRLHTGSGHVHWELDDRAGLAGKKGMSTGNEQKPKNLRSARCASGVGPAVIREGRPLVGERAGGRPWATFCHTLEDHSALLAERLDLRGGEAKR